MKKKKAKGRTNFENWLSQFMWWQDANGEWVIVKKPTSKTDANA